MQMSAITAPISRKKCDTKIPNCDTTCQPWLLLPVEKKRVCVKDRKDVFLASGQRRLHRAADLSYMSQMQPLG